MIDPKQQMEIDVVCPFCKENNIITMSVQQFFDYYSGKKPIGQVFSEKSATEREILLSGICGVCWDKHFKIEERVL